MPFPLKNWFDWSRSSPTAIPSAAAQHPTWRLACGAIDPPTSGAESPIWQEGGIALFAAPVEAERLIAVSPSGRFVAIGEVQLIGSPHDLQRDLQQVAYLWQQAGDRTWSDIIGTFSLAIWDRTTQTLQVGRDRTGSQTLYYTTAGSTCWLAPRLRSLLPYHGRQLDPIALRDYLCCAFVPGERTLWRDVRELRPGTVLELSRIHPGVRFDRRLTDYWQLQERITGADQPLNWHGDRLRQRLEQVVQEMLPGDPVGCFLSGGLDSSCVTALARQFHRGPLHTFSIHFGSDCPNELEFSGLVAQHCQTQHHILEISFAQMWDHLPETMAALDDPIGDPLTVPNLLLGRLAQQFVPVVFNGEGGDPCFGGPKNQPMLIHSLYGALTQVDPVQAYLNSFHKCAIDLPQLLQPDLWQAVQAEPSCFAADLQAPIHYLNRLMAINIKFKGADQILTKVNNLTRAAGIAGRSPLFDQRVVELSLEIPPDYKLSGVQEKAVLKQAVADLLPAAIIHRPKSGMMVPVQLGFRQHWNAAARALLLNRRAAIAPYLNQKLIRQWLDYQGDVWGRYGVKLWLLVSLEYWLRANGMGE